MHYPFRLWAYVQHCGIVYLSDDFCRTGAVMLTRCTCIRRASRKRWKRRRPSWRGYTTTFIGRWRRSRRARTTSTTIWNSLCPASAWRRTVWPRWRSNIGRRAAESPNAREHSTRWVRSAPVSECTVWFVARFGLVLVLVCWTCNWLVLGSNAGRRAVECNPGQVVRPQVPLSPGSIIWYRPVRGDALLLGT